MQTCILTLSLETADIFEEERELARQRDELAEKARKEQVPLLSACAVCVCVRCVCLCVCVYVCTRGVGAIHFKRTGIQYVSLYSMFFLHVFALILKFWYP
jgi:CO dehydrogenase/acetyl-CoA synthase beta subunit